MKLTDWFPPSIKPKRRGIYITRLGLNEAKDSGAFFQYWSGTYWKAKSETIHGADSMKRFNSLHQHVYWKGIQR
jgi:hypothetical protein